MIRLLHKQLGGSHKSCRIMSVMGGNCFFCSAGASSNDSSTAASESVGNGQEELCWKTRLLHRAVQQVPVHGWTIKSVRVAAGELGLAEAAAGMLENGAADLVLHFAEACNKQLVKDMSQWCEEQQSSNHLGTSKVIHEAVQRRLQMIVPHRKTWPEALALCSSPTVAPLALDTLLSLFDDIWYLAGDRSTEFSWYTKRAMLASVSCSTELFLMMDESDGQQETWRFLERRLRNVADFGQCQAQAQKTAGSLLQSAREAGHAALKMTGF